MTSKFLNWTVFHVFCKATKQCTRCYYLRADVMKRFLFCVLKDVMKRFLFSSLQLVPWKVIDVRIRFVRYVRLLT